ncbi:MAG: SLBB domain-containing protein [Ekhidna sp.]|nr:SLBB domain-containing protein [Ekhidna sp.]
MRTLRYLLAAASFTFGLILCAQNVDNVSVSDLANINIDKLSDKQIQQFLNRVEESGFTLDELEVIARQRGVPESQIAKLKTRIRQLQLRGKRDKDNVTDPLSRLRKIEENDNEENNPPSLFSLLPSSDSLQNKKLEIFGMDIFRRADIEFEPSLNVATPENYILGAGDEVIIDVYGASEITYQQVISPYGKVLISGIGPVSLGGLTIRQAKVRLLNKLSTIYSGLESRSPNTFIDVSVGQVRSIKVNVVGAITQPGTYTISSFSTAFNALYFAGGPNKSGSMREIQVIRKGERIATLDIYKYLLLGEDSQNPQLLDQDIVLIKPYLNRVKLAGNVKNPAIYELKEAETVDFLFSISGGFSEKAFKNSIIINRVGESEREVKTVSLAHFSSEQIQNGDSIFVTPVLDTYSNRVMIKGAVNRPGTYELTKDLSLSKVISLAGGLREDAYLKRGNIVRQGSDLRLTNLTFDAKEVVDGNQDILLSPEDLILLTSIFELEEKQTITIKGRVRKPGDYPFISGMNVEDLINLAGGLEENANFQNVEVTRRVFKNDDPNKSSKIFTFPLNSDSSQNEQSSPVQLMPFDLVLIKSVSHIQKQKIIKIEGEVKFPGFYALKTNDDKISNLIQRAGGLTSYGYAEGATLIRKTAYFKAKTKQKELAENDQFNAQMFKEQRFFKLLKRDSISGTNNLEDLEERLTIGIELQKILKIPDSKFDLTLKDGDLLVIPQKLETVSIQGEVLYPNTVRFNEGSPFKSYVSSAGGFSPKAKVGKSYIVYANGTAKRTKNFLFFKDFPPVKPGSNILIPYKREGRRLTPTEVIGITSGLISLSFVVTQLVEIYKE